MVGCYTSPETCNTVCRPIDSQEGTVQSATVYITGGKIYGMYAYMNVKVMGGGEPYLAYASALMRVHIRGCGILFSLSNMRQMSREIAHGSSYSCFSFLPQF